MDEQVDRGIERIGDITDEGSDAYWRELEAIDARFYATNPRAKREREIVARREAKIRAYLEERSNRRVSPRIPIPQLIRFRVLKRCGFACAYCGRRAPDVQLQIDHIRPVSKGGTNDESNLTSACWDCNIGKGAMLLDGDAP